MPRTVGLIMAGGGGTRLQQSGIAVPKPLLSVNGMTLLERNFVAFARAGLTDVVISVSDAVPEVGDFVATRLASTAEACSIQLSAVRESSPLGNIGAVGLLADDDATVVVTFSDNLTTLPLADFASAHERAGAAMTLAVHREPIQMPFGELVLDGADVIDYVEKPVSHPWIASAVCALAPRARRAVPTSRPSGLVDLFRALRAGGERIAAYEHAHAWTDVNDAAALRRAQRLVADDQAAFDCFAPPGVATRSVAFASDGRVVLLSRDGGGRLTLPACSHRDAARPPLAFDVAEPGPGHAEVVRHLVVEGDHSLLGDGSIDRELCPVRLDDIVDHDAGAGRTEIEIADIAEIVRRAATTIAARSAR